MPWKWQIIFPKFQRPSMVWTMSNGDWLMTQKKINFWSLPEFSEDRCCGFRHSMQIRCKILVRLFSMIGLQADRKLCSLLAPRLAATSNPLSSHLPDRTSWPLNKGGIQWDLRGNHPGEFFCFCGGGWRGGGQYMSKHDRCERNEFLTLNFTKFFCYCNC